MLQDSALEFADWKTRALPPWTKEINHFEHWLISWYETWQVRREWHGPTLQSHDEFRQDILWNIGSVLILLFSLPSHEGLFQPTAVSFWTKWPSRVFVRLPCLCRFLPGLPFRWTTGCGPVPSSGGRILGSSKRFLQSSKGKVQEVSKAESPWGCVRAVRIDFFNFFVLLGDTTWAHSEGKGSLRTWACVEYSLRLVRLQD